MFINMRQFLAVLWTLRLSLHFYPLHEFFLLDYETILSNLKFHQQLETLNCVFHEIIGKEVELFKSETHHVLLNRYKVLKVRIVFFVLPVNHALFQNLNYNECALHDRNQSYCNPFRTTGFFLYPLKTENLWFFNVFKE